MIKELGGVSIRVNRPSVNILIDDHESESLINSLEVNYEIKNDATIDKLYESIDNIIMS